jgi:hypothetical protein
MTVDYNIKRVGVTISVPACALGLHSWTLGFPPIKCKKCGMTVTYKNGGILPIKGEVKKE